MFKMPLHRRQCVAKNRNERYRTDADYRLARINERRRRDGCPEFASLADVRLRVPLAGV